MRKKQEICIITGCTSGLGYEILKGFLKKNYKIYGISNNKIKIKMALKKLKEENYNLDNFFLKRVDVSNSIEVKKYVKNISKIEKKIDILISNAGVYGPIGKFEETNTKEWKKAFDINFFGSLNMFREVIPIMKENNYGRIIQISGGGATKSLPMFTSYASAKVAIVRFAETISEELNNYNIKINCIAPGALNTVFLDQALKAGPKKTGENFYKKMIIITKRGGDDMSQTVNLCLQLSNKKSKINGKIISSLWDKWSKFVNNDALNRNDVYTLRRIIGSDRKLNIFDV